MTADGDGSEESALERTIAGYDSLAERPDRIPWGAGDYQRYYVWPSVRPLLPDVEGRRVLDAGCGIGDYVEWFLDEGASVVGVDASGRALDRARDRFGDRATFHKRDLREPLSFAADGAFDLVFCNLVLDHLPEWRPVFAEFQRVLSPDGTLVFTTIHPTRRYRRHRERLPTYHETAGYTRPWSEDADLTSYHRPMGAIVSDLTDAGFRIDAFEEPRPPAEYERYDPERYRTAIEWPDLLCVRALPRPGSDRAVPTRRPDP